MLIRHPDSARGNDLYETPEVATLALLRAEPLPRAIWEPACGPGAIVRVLRDAGHRVIATDLFDYHSPEASRSNTGFLLKQFATPSPAARRKSPHRFWARSLIPSQRNHFREASDGC